MLLFPAPKVYLNQQRWDGAEIPEMTVNVNINFKDPALEKIEQDQSRATKMPQDVAEKLRELRKQFTQHTQIVH